MKYANFTKGSAFTSQLAKLLCAAALLGAFSTSAYAAPILGEVSYGFFLTPEDGSGNQVSLGSATFLDFESTSTFAFGSGDFSTISSLTLTDFAIDPFAAPQHIWSGAGFDFSLDTLAIQNQSDTQLGLRGFGYASGNGYDPTYGEWTLSANASGGNTFVFSAIVDVPEPGPLALFGLGLVGIGLIRRRKQAAK